MEGEGGGGERGEGEGENVETCYMELRAPT